jgi:prevent-host-death family protein
VSAREAKNSFGLMIDTARAEPVRIEKHGRGVVVVVSVEEYERLSVRPEVRSRRSCQPARKLSMAVPREPYPVVDVFAGPCGLGEGFAALRGKSYSARFDSVVSIERDESAHQTLLLRHSLRRFPYQQFPDDYYRYLRRRHRPRRALSEPPRGVLGGEEERFLKISLGPDSHAEVKRIISRKLKGQQKWALVGGPPCQAYSIPVGRSRMMGDPDFEEDERHTLYLEYLKIIIDHELSPEVGDGGNSGRRHIVGCLTPPLLHRRSDMPCPRIPSSD